MAENNPSHEKPVATTILAVAFLSLGLLVGTLLAFSAQSLAQAVVAGLFTLIGGSLIAFFDKTTAQAQRAAVVALLGLSVGSLVGVYTGIIVNEHMVLSPKWSTTIRSGAVSAPTPGKYLRENTLTLVDEIDAKHRTGVLTADQAYAELYKTVKK